MATWERAYGSEGGFTATLRMAVEHMREIGDADIVALYPYDEETEAFYAPVALGLPDDDLVRALPDMADQLRRFHADRVEGKMPDELLPAHYGPHAWLLNMRRPLVSADPAHEVDSSFIRRSFSAVFTFVAVISALRNRRNVASPSPSPSDTRSPYRA